MEETRKTILITGGSGLIGKELTHHFLKSGWNVIATTYQKRSAEQLQKYFCDFDSLRVIQSDLNDNQSAETLRNKIEDRSDLPYAIINNARSLDHLETDSKGQVSREHFASELTLDVIVPYEISMEFGMAPGSPLKKILNVSSMYGVVAANRELYTNYERQSPLHYSVSKAAVIHLTKELAVRFAPLEIDVNCISLGGIAGRVDDQFMERYSKLCPNGRMLQKAEISQHVDYLVSPQTSGLTGHNLIVDGGWTTW
ncbi:SDR family oxidoreductase [Thalassospira sp. GB04J01]|uniref:SDR family oxidoreductase n=1 Tax=Thalassospira sp. GB04J01 TaxID=1485225 RepID=UPI000C9C4965|nr:SDR family oxidoreductase [Thalassospira sp. GB04J01]|tara:strand:- start:99002 stop:99766 length:765 start_codon:yes stop_codon:yes gene_type:complete